MLAFALFALLLVGCLAYVNRVQEAKAPGEFTDERIKQQWRDLGFFCEVDHVDKTWTLTGSRRGLLFFPDLLLGYVADPANAAPGSKQKYGPYGTLQLMTWTEPGFGNSIHGSTRALTHLAEVVEAKLATAEPGDMVRIRREYAPNSPYTLILDIRPDNFDPSAADRERLGAATLLPTEAEKKAKASDKS